MKICNSLFKVFLPTLLIIFFFYPLSAQNPEEGKKLFQQNCASCHKINKKLIGPKLSGINDKKSEDWLIRWIQNSQALIESGDEYANQIYEKFNKLVMPPAPLNEKEVKSVLAYIKQESQKKEGTNAKADKTAGGAGKKGEIALLKEDPRQKNIKNMIYFLVFLFLAILVISLGILQFTLRYKGIHPKINWSRVNSVLFLIFLIVGFIAIFYELNLHTKFLRPEAASKHGKDIDWLFNLTLIITSIVFVITQILLFYFSFRYRGKKGKKGFYYPMNNKLEVFWTAIPAVVLTILILLGFKTWREVTSPPAKGTSEVEVYAYRFGWKFRYPGEDGKLGKTDFRLTSPSNPLALKPGDETARDDIITSELHLPVNQLVNLKFRARDVIHSAWFNHFRVQMYCQPGMNTQFKFTPTITTQKMREKTGNKEFGYELACNQICGAGHYNMKALVVVEKSGTYQDWLAQKTPFLKKQ